MVNQYNVLIPDGQIKSVGHCNQPTGFVSSWAIEVRKENHGQLVCLVSFSCLYVRFTFMPAGVNAILCFASPLATTPSDP
jgi:hypothetical protein